MKIIHEITMDLSRQGIQVTIPLTQFDIASHRVVIHLRNGSKPVKIDPRQHAIAVPSVGGLESVYTYAEESAYPNCLVYDVSKAITGTPGIHEATIKVLGLDGSVLGTPKLAFMVREDLTAESMIDTDDGQAAFRLFLDATNDINAYLGEKDTLKTEALTLTGAVNELHDGKVDKIEISDGWMDNGIHGVYGIDDSGNPVLFPATPEAINDSVAFRDANGRIKTGTPVENSDAVPKSYADGIKSALLESVNKKADKLTNPYGDPSVYAIDGNSDTQRAIRLSSAAIGGSAMLRDGNGRTRVASPVDEEDAANKGFVERTIDSKINEIKLIEIVSSLPSVGKPNKIYLVPKADSQSNDLYDEYLWNEVTGKWEWVTTKQLEVDLSGHATIPYVNQTFANALKGSASGEAVLIDDVSPVEHDVGVTVRGKNLLQLHDAGYSVTKGGVTFTWLEGGRVQVNGTATEDVEVHVNTVKYTIKGGVRYFISGCPSGGSLSTYYLHYRGYDQDIGSGRVIGGQSDFTNDVDIMVKSGVTVNNLIFSPMLELGTTGTAFAPHIADLSAVKVSRYGKNLWKPFEGSATVNGITATLKDGYITFSGTFTESTTISIDPPSGYNSHIYPAGAYRFAVEEIVTDLMVQARTVVGDDWLVNVSGTSGNVTQPFILKSVVVVVSTADMMKMKFPVMVITSSAWNPVCTYEPYIEPSIHSVNSDGSVEGVRSADPSMTMLTDTAGAVVECNYNLDLNKAFEKITQAIISIGGNV